MFLDTSGLLCVHSKAESQHAEAARLFMGDLPHLTHSYVLAELVALAEARGLPRKSILGFVRDLQANPFIEVVYVDQVLHDEGISLLENRSDKSWSLCDAVSFVLMNDRGLKDALTTDHHFVQAGFVKRLSP